MSKDLDEYGDKQLWDEINRRNRSRSQGICDYCNRLGYEASCKEKGRHSRAAYPWLECADCGRHALKQSEEAQDWAKFWDVTSQWRCPECASRRR